MAGVYLRRRLLLLLFPAPSRRFSSPASILLPSLFSSAGACSVEFSTDLVDHGPWAPPPWSHPTTGFHHPPTPPTAPEDPVGLDAIDDLRVQKKLFYKLDRNSREFEESNVEFHRRGKMKRQLGNLSKSKLGKRSDPSTKKPSINQKENKKTKDSWVKEGISIKPLLRDTKPPKASSVKDKKERVPTFNQLTDPYHLPFCLDLHITKGSVRASVIHRLTSKVVAVAHSISKDLKFDLNSRRDSIACATVGKVLAQRAMEDDIFNVVYTPRKGDKIEGKLQILLQSVIDGGIHVNVKLKKKSHLKLKVGNSPLKKN